MPRKSVVIGPRVEDITYRKPDGGLWRHKFSRRASVRGNADGSVTIKSDDPKTRLHKLFPFEGRQEPFLINPPRRRSARRNPIQIINPPRRKTMKRRMPAALAKYWATHRRKKAKAKPRRNPWRERGQAAHLVIGGKPAGPVRNSNKRSQNRGTSTLAPRHRRAALLGLNKHRSRRTVAAKFALMTTTSKEYPMAKSRKSRRRKAAHNPPRRRHSRRNPPFFAGSHSVSNLTRDGGAVAAGIILPQLSLRLPQLAGVADTPLKRGLAKALIGFGLSRLAKKFVGQRAADMMLVGTASNIIMADVLPRVAPKLGLGLSDTHDPSQFPVLNEMFDAPQLMGPDQGMDDQGMDDQADLGEMYR